MRKIALFTPLIVLCLAPTMASAKLPYFGLDVHPLDPSVGEPITVTLTCYADRDHVVARSSCFGDHGVMAWVHPLDDEGEIDRSDWIPVLGHPTSSGASRGSITIPEPGAYDVLPLWRRWGPEHSDGFPDPIRLEVRGGPGIAPIAATLLAVLGMSLVAAARRRRTVSR